MRCAAHSADWDILILTYGKTLYKNVKHKSLRSVSAVAFKYLTSMGVCRCSIFLVLPPLLTSLPQAFCSLGRTENRMMERNIHHSSPVPEFLMRHGNAPTYQQISSNSVHMETRPHNQMQNHKQSSMRLKKKERNKAILLHRGLCLAMLCLEHEANWYCGPQVKDNLNPN